MKLTTRGASGRGRRPPGILLSVALAAAVLCSGAASEARGQGASRTEIKIGVLSRRAEPSGYYEPEPVPEDDGLAGGRVAVRDNNTTGAFTGHRYAVEEIALDPGSDPVGPARDLLARGAGFLIANLPADELLAVSDALKAEPVVLFNVAASDDRLRGADCRANLLHVVPSRAMLTDALAQFLAFKRWRKLFLVVGPQPADGLYAEATRRAARKSGLQIAAEKPWEFGPLARVRADSPTTAEALVFTRGVDHDVMVVADEAGDFGDYLAFRTAEPRVIAGTQGLTTTTWHPQHELWGAGQMQSRFRRSANRLMRPLDYHVWMAVRAVGEAVTQTKQTDPRALRRYMLSDQFGLPAYKGVSLTFRPWDRQLRQPILIVHPKAIVSVAPQPGFLHQRTPLDSLGFDEPESACKSREAE
jgi:ABC transporter substrate binding protein (PQQ-dependent alcohol dehydrogenase system)